MKKGLTVLFALLLIIAIACNVSNKEETVDTPVVEPVEEVKEVVPEVMPEVPKDNDNE